jgi:hypothetical protein
VTDPVFMFCAPGLVFGGTEGVGPRFMFCALRLIFGGTEGVMSHIHVLRSRAHFRWSRGRRVLFPCFALPDTFSAIPMASVHVFMFCTSGLVFSGTEGVGSHFHVLCSRTHFSWYRGHRVMFSYFHILISRRYLG